MQRPLSRLVLGLAVLSAVIVAQIIAFEHAIVLRAPGFHVIMHVAGGMGIGLFAMALVSRYAFPMAQSRYIVLMTVLIFGLSWELFETIFNITGFAPGTVGYYVDMTKDIVFDLVGGICIVAIMK